MKIFANIPPCMTFKKGIILALVVGGEGSYALHVKKIICNPPYLKKILHTNTQTLSTNVYQIATEHVFVYCKTFRVPSGYLNVILCRLLLPVSVHGKNNLFAFMILHKLLERTIVNMKTKISLQCPSLLVFYSFLKIYYIEKDVKLETQMAMRCLPVLRLAELSISYNDHSTSLYSSAPKSQAKSTSLWHTRYIELIIHGCWNMKNIERSDNIFKLKFLIWPPNIVYWV